MRAPAELPAGIRSKHACKELAAAPEPPPDVAVLPDPVVPFVAHPLIKKPKIVTMLNTKTERCTIIRLLHEVMNSLIRGAISYSQSYKKDKPENVVQAIRHYRP